jgi:hypothetical protein
VPPVAMFGAAMTCVARKRRVTVNPSPPAKGLALI